MNTAVFSDEDIDKLLVEAFTAAKLDDEELPELDWQIDGVLPEGLTVLAGTPKAGKSFFAASIALAVASGGELFGQSATQRPVLYLALEDGKRRLQKRLRALYRLDAGQDLLGTNKLPAGLHLLCRVEPHLLQATIAAFLQRHEDRKPLIVLDTFGRVKPPRAPGAEPYQADYQYASSLKGLVDAVPGAALLVVHHTRKPKASEALEDFVDALSGTNGLAGAADTIVLLSRKRGSDEAELKITGRDVPENEYALVADNPTGSALHWRLDGDSLTAAAETARGRAAEAERARRTKDLGDRILDVWTFVSGRPGIAFFTPKYVADGINASKPADAPDMTNNDAGTYLRRLEAKGLVAKVGHGKYKSVSELSELSESDDNRTSEHESDSDSTQTNSDSQQGVSEFRQGVSEFRQGVSESENEPDQHRHVGSDNSDSSDTVSFRERGSGVPPGAPTAHTPGRTDRVEQALAKAREATPEPSKTEGISTRFRLLTAPLERNHQ